MNKLRVEEVAWDHPASVSLRAEQRAEIAIRYGTPDSEPGPEPGAHDITAFFVAFGPSSDGGGDDEPLACGGVRALDDEHAEVKRMYVRPAARGTGAATSIIRRLEEYGRGSGWRRLVLETGDRQPDAVRFYSREGYGRIPNFGYYEGHAASLCFARDL